MAPSDQSPISILPEDILRLVFATAYGDVGPGKPRFVTSVALSHVCQLWRDVALDSGQLWSHIAGNSPRDLPRMGVLLARSRGTPLSLSIQLNGSRQYRGSPIYLSLIDVVLPHLARCCTLSISGESNSIILFLRILSGSPVPSNALSSRDITHLHGEQYIRAPLLESLEIYNIGGRTVEPIGLGILFGGFTPRLKQIRCRRVLPLPLLPHAASQITSFSVDSLNSIEQCTSLVHLDYSGFFFLGRQPLDITSLRRLTWTTDPNVREAHSLLSSKTWSRLTEISLNRANSWNAIQLLSGTPNVRHVSVSLSRGVPHIRTRPPKVFLPHLTSLVLQCERDSRNTNAPDFLDLIISPKLRSLVLRYAVPDRFAPGYLERVEHLINQSNPPLLRLSCVNQMGNTATDETDSAILSIVREEAPQLRVLHVTPCGGWTRYQLGEILDTRNGHFCEREDDVMRPLKGEDVEGAI